jgi:hypothetical protein
VHCTPINLGDGVTGWTCGRRPARKPCCECRQRPHTKLSDFKLTGTKRGKTCDRPLCDACAVTVGRRGTDSVDYCRAHAELAQKLPAQLVLEVE